MPPYSAPRWRRDPWYGLHRSGGSSHLKGWSTKRWWGWHSCPFSPRRPTGPKTSLKNRFVLQSRLSTKGSLDDLLYVVVYVPSVHPSDGHEIDNTPEYPFLMLNFVLPNLRGRWFTLTSVTSKAFHLQEGGQETVHALKELQLYQTLSPVCLKRPACIDNILLTQLVP